MTENEAIKVLEEKYRTMSMCMDIEECKRNNQAISKAIDVLKEIQQYRSIGTVEEIRKVVQFLSLDNGNGIIEDMEELNKYKAIGTVSECREAAEKQKVKKTDSTGYGLNMNDTVKSISTIKNFMANASRTTCNEFLYGALQNAVEIMEKQIPKPPIDDTAFGLCPNCHSEFNSELINEYDMKYCLHCGQALETGG